MKEKRTRRQAERIKKSPLTDRRTNGRKTEEHTGRQAEQTEEKRDPTHGKMDTWGLLFDMRSEPVQTGGKKRIRRTSHCGLEQTKIET